MVTAPGQRINGGSVIAEVPPRRTGRAGIGPETAAGRAARAGIVIFAPSHGEGWMTGVPGWTIE